MRTTLVVVCAALAWALVGCSSATTCDATLCSGCCSAAGVCEGGTTPLACGSVGTTCSVCSAGQSCLAGACLFTGSGGGAGGGSGGAGGGGGGSTFTPLTFAEYCASIGSAGCPFLVACGYYAAQSACEAFYANVDYCQAARAALKDGRVRFDGVLAARCVAQQRAQTTCAVFVASTSGPDCSRVVDGQVANGQSCFEDTDCLKGSYCTSQPAVSCGGTCQPRKQLGATVSRLGECLEGLSVYGGVCVTPLAEGLACSPVAPSSQPRPCAWPAFCDGQTCVGYRGVGQSCSGNQCLYGSCVGGSCQAYAKQGEACSTTQRCASDLFCNAGTCAPLSGAGGPCFDWSSCQRGLYCSKNDGTQGQCLARKGANATCSVWWECVASTYCDQSAKQCLALKPTGAACADFGGCAASCNLSSCWTPSCTGGVCTPAFCVDPTP